MKENEIIFNESKKYMPGGVNSPVRSYRGMDMTPPIIKSGKGAIIVDEEGKEYIVFVLAWGPLLLGHCNEKVVEAIKETSEKALAFGAPTFLELEMSRFLCENMPNVEMIRMVNSGTEATMSAIKLARGYTKRDKIVKFAGCYHGHFDGFLVEAGSGVLTDGIPGSLGVPEDSIKNTLIGVYNDEEQLVKLFKKYGKEIAADWTAGYAEDAVVISQLNDEHVTDGTAAKAAELEKNLRAGNAKVFNTEKFTIDGSSLDTLATSNTNFKKYKKYIKNGNLQESMTQSKSIFDTFIDGITESTQDYLAEQSADSAESTTQSN